MEMNFKFGASFLTLILLLGCASSPGTSGSATSNVNNQGGSVGGNLTSIAKTGSGGTGGAISQTTDVRVALDPAAFSSIFGAAASAVKPTIAQLSQLEGYAKSQTSSIQSEILAVIEKCREKGSNCEIVKK